MEEKHSSSIYSNHKLKKAPRSWLRKLILGVIILLLLAGNIYFFVQYSTAKKEAAEATIELQAEVLNEKIINFIQLFISKVLKAEDEVDFETRLSLENAVRNLDDKEILNQWQKFTESESEAEAQAEVKNLLEILVSKIKK